MRCLFVSVRELEQGRFAEGFSKERDTDGQIVAGEAGRYGHRCDERFSYAFISPGNPSAVYSAR